MISGKAFDMGVVSIRKMVSPSELTVVWSVYQVFYIQIYILIFFQSVYQVFYIHVYIYRDSKSDERCEHARAIFLPLLC